MPRRLNDRFMSGLKDGCLRALLERVKFDRTLCLEIRENYINIYYRGGNLLRVSQTPDGYLAFFAEEYAGSDGGAFSATMPPASMRNLEDVALWLGFFPSMKAVMDLFLGRTKSNEEREAQQSIVRENNFGGISNATDYFICDIEYANPHGRFDMVAVHWPSEPSIRRKDDGRRLVLVEAKFGDGALREKGGIHSHIVDINRFLSNPADVSALKNEMVVIFNQKRDLGLIDCGKDLAAFSEGLPILLLTLVNHDPDKTNLRTALDDLPPSPYADIYLASSCFMGYGLFDQAVLPLAEARTRLGTLI